MNKPFRDWLQKMYYENKLERIDWYQAPLTLSEYFNNNKYWLKREFRFQHKQKS